MNRTRGGVVQQRTAAAQRRYAPSEADESVASEVGSAAPVNELFQAIKLGQSLQVAVDNWIAGYKDDANEALCELLNLLMIVSGCRGQITVEHLAVESTTVIQQLTEQFDEDSGEYPFMSNGQHARRLRANFADFLLIFMRQIQHSIVFDEFLVENFLNFVIALTDSQVRAFRHTATFAGKSKLTWSLLVSRIAPITVHFVLSCSNEDTHRISGECSAIADQSGAREEAVRR